MMRSNEVVYLPGEGVVHAAGPLSAHRMVVAARDVRDLQVVAGEGASVRAWPDKVRVETLTRNLLRLERVGDTVRVSTQIEPDAPVETGGLKDGEPVHPEFDDREDVDQDGEG